MATGPLRLPPRVAQVTPPVSMVALACVARFTATPQLMCQLRRLDLHGLTLTASKTANPLGPGTLHLWRMLHYPQPPTSMVLVWARALGTLLGAPTLSGAG